MKRYLKFATALLALGVLTGVAVLAYLAMTFDPKDYKEKIIQLVREKNQRQLSLDGEIKLKFFPSIGIDIGKVTLSEFQSETEFLSVDHARISLALIPLLTGKWVVDDVVVNGLRARMDRFKDGKTSVDDFAGKHEGETEPGQAVQFAISSVRLDQARIIYRDHASGRIIELNDVTLQTGRIANKTKGKVDFSARIAVNDPAVDILAKGRATLKFDLDSQLFELGGLKLHVTGSAMDIRGLSLQANGDIGANISAQELTTREFMLFVTGKWADDDFEAKLEAPELMLTAEKFESPKLQLSAKAGGVAGSAAGSLTLTDLSGNARLFRSNELHVVLEAMREGKTVKTSLRSPVSGNYPRKQLNLSAIKIAVEAAGKDLPQGKISGELTGSMQIDGSRQSGQASLEGRLDQSQVKTRISIANFTSPSIRFDAVADKFDADPFLSSQGSEAAGGPDAGATELNVPPIGNLDVSGSVRVGALKAGNVKLANVRVATKMQNGIIRIDPASADLYGGNLQGNYVLNTRGTPEITLHQKLNSVNIAPLLKDAAGLDMLEGKGHLDVDLNSRGRSMAALKRGLQGTAAINLKDGAILGIDLDKRIRAIQSGGRDEANNMEQGRNSGEKTEFTEFRARFNVKNGVAHNNDLSVRSRQLRLAGNGDIDIGADRINYEARATVARSADGQGGTLTVPVHISGPYGDLKYRIDYEAVLKDVAKQKIENKKEQLKGRVKEQLNDRLKGLFR